MLKTGVWPLLREAFLGQIAHGRVKAETHPCLLQRALLLPLMWKQTRENVYGTDDVLLRSWFLLSQPVWQTVPVGQGLRGPPFTVWEVEAPWGVSPVTHMGLELKQCPGDRILSEQACQSLPWPGLTAL